MFNGELSKVFSLKQHMRQEWPLLQLPHFTGDPGSCNKARKREKGKTKQKDIKLFLS